MDKSNLKKKIDRAGLLPQARFLFKYFYLKPKEFFLNFIGYGYNNILTHVPSYALRKFYLTTFMGVKIGKGSFIHMGCIFYKNVSIGKNSVIGRQCHLLGNITIKDNVSITAQTYIASSSHYTNSLTFQAFTRPVVIENRVWIGARAMILPGVKISEGAVLGAMSIATADIPEFKIYAGNPAKLIGERNKEIEYTLNYQPFFQ